MEGIALGQSDSKLKEIYVGGDLFFIALYSRRRDLLLAAVRLPFSPFKGKAPTVRAKL